MSQQTSRTTVDSVVWSSFGRYSVGINVSHNGGVWVNTTGKNSEPGVGSDWTGIGGGGVLSVNGQTGAVILDADNIDDTLTVKKFATESQLNQIEVNEGVISANLSIFNGVVKDIVTDYRLNTTSEITDISTEVMDENVIFIHDYNDGNIVNESLFLFKKTLDTDLTNVLTQTRNKILFYDKFEGSNYSLTFSVTSTPVYVPNLDNEYYAFIVNGDLPEFTGTKTGKIYWQFISQSRNPMTILCSGQSNMVNNETYMNDGGDKDSDARVEVFDDILGAFKVAEIGVYPFPSILNDEGKYNNNTAFHIAKRLAEKENRQVRIIFEATGGQSIDKWTDSGVNSEYFVNIVNKIDASGTTKIDGIFWLQGESDAYDVDYPEKINELITNLRGLPSISSTVPFVAGQMAYGYDVSGVPQGTTGTAPNESPFSAGYVLNQRFYRQFNNFVTDQYFNVADGSSLATVSQGVAIGIHFEGTAIVEYSYLFAESFYNTPVSKPSLINNKGYNPTTLINGNSTLGWDENEIVYLDASLGNISVPLPLPSWSKKFTFKRIDKTDNNCVISAGTGYTINNAGTTYNLIKHNQVVKVIPSNTVNYDIVSNNYNYNGATLIQSSLVSNGNIEKHINLDNVTNDVLLNFYLPNVSYGLSFYVRCIDKNLTKACRVKFSAASNLDTGADIDLEQDDMYYFYSDGTTYYSKKLI